ncbi:Far upstream element-binding protein 2 [Triplophysa tibetana]|uniref:Far upstream element-binding protein 2 n=1 Tax=Triplophysa tibetana TaxID=1572043 RepID=A0A5A9PJ75_9TELE|nr:Far upstream element-binding protein 2 [Triplophysa tibetana]
MSEYSAVTPPGPGAALGAGGLKKDAFADAVQRARQIAAKIGGDVSGPPMSNNGGSEGYSFSTPKRSLEDPINRRAKRWRLTETALQPCAIEAQLAALSQQSVRPSAMTEDYRVPDGMVGLIIGRGGEQINKIQQDSGCKVQIAPDSCGLPDRSVSLTGPPEAIQKAKMLLDDIVSRGRGTPPSFHESTNGNGHMQEMVIPAGKAGLIIGKGGETIKQLQERAGVKMILIQDASQGPNIDKPLRIIGDPYKVQQAREMVDEILRERDQPGFDRNEYGSQMGGARIEVPVPRHSVGVVIGRSGEMIKKIQNDAGVRIQFKPDDGTGPDKIANIVGPPDRCEHAASIINELLQSIRVREEGGGGPSGPPGAGMPPGGRGRGHGPGSWGPPGGEMTFSIPAHKCGLVIGRGGENVKAINQQTGAFVEISRQPPPNGDPNFKLFTIRGSPQQIDHAKQLIEDKIEGPLCPVGPGPGGPGPGGPMGPYNPNPYQPGPLASILRVGGTHTSSGSRMIQVKQRRILMQPGRLITRSTTSSLLEVPCPDRRPVPSRLHPLLLTRVKLLLAQLSPTTPRPGKSTTRRWGKLREVEGLCRQQEALQLQALQQQGKQITAPHGLNTTDSRLLITDRQDRPRDSQDQHRRASRLSERFNVVFTSVLRPGLTPPSPCAPEKTKFLLFIFLAVSSSCVTISAGSTNAELESNSAFSLDSFIPLLPHVNVTHGQGNTRESC